MIRPTSLKIENALLRMIKYESSPRQTFLLMRKVLPIQTRDQKIYRVDKKRKDIMLSMMRVPRSWFP